MGWKFTLPPALMLVGLSAQTAIPGQNPLTEPADMQRGARLFGLNCAPCHGPKGDGGRGPNLAQLKLPRANDDTALFQIIHDGIPGTEMPATKSLTDHEMWQVAAYVRTLGRVLREKLPGDPAAGAALFRAKGCFGCHAVGAEGGRMGPPLAEIGERRSAAYLRAVLLDPASNLPSDFAMAEISTTAGSRITGMVLNEDTYSIQMRDLNGNLHSFWKRELSALDRLPGRTPMPSFRERLGNRELDDLVAYLASLRGKP